MSNETDKCPKCGMPFDPEEYSIHQCPQCGVEGSSKCCNSGGNNCLCNDCEEESE